MSARAEEDHSVVEVAFHNTALHRKRVPLLTDFYHFSMAALNAQVSLPWLIRALLMLDSSTQELWQGRLLCN